MTLFIDGYLLVVFVFSHILLFVALEEC